MKKAKYVQKFRIDEDCHEKIERRANKECRTFVGMVRFILIEWLRGQK